MAVVREATTKLGGRSWRKRRNQTVGGGRSLRKEDKRTRREDRGT